jgi:GMP synthase-like glutamine amidotransferase
MGLFPRVVQNLGAQVVELNMCADPTPDDISAFDGVVIFGGPMHADDDDRYLWLREEKRLLSLVLARKIPALGVCLGAQLIAAVGGASVFTTPDQEHGWTAVELLGAGVSDPVIGTLPRHFQAFNWHVDTWSLPTRSGAIELARSQFCPQAFRLDDTAWGVQFHPEVDRAMARRWIDRDCAAEDREVIWQRVEARIDEWNSLAESLFAAFVGFAAAQS